MRAAGAPHLQAEILVLPSTFQLNIPTHKSTVFRDLRPVPSSQNKPAPSPVTPVPSHHSSRGYCSPRPPHPTGDTVGRFLCTELNKN